MKKRNFTILASSALLAGCLIAAPAALRSNTASAAGTADFQMAYGAAIRTKQNDMGIRFTALLSESKYTEVNGDANKKFGMLIVPTDYLEGVEDTDQDGTPNYVEHIQANYTQEIDGKTVTLGLMNSLNAYSYNFDKSADGSTDICISGAITNMQFKNMNRDFVGIAFIETATTEEGGDTTYSYEYAAYPEGETDYCTRNITYVASAAYADPEDREKHGEALKGFVENGVKQAANLTEEDAMPAVTISLDKTEIPYLSDTQVAVQYGVSGEILDIDLYSTIVKAEEDVAVAELLTGNVISPFGFDVSPETLATITAAGVNLEIRVPALSEEVVSQNVKIECEYDSMITLEKIAINAGIAFDMAAYIRSQPQVSLQSGHNFEKYIYSSNAKLHRIHHENGVFTLANEAMTSTNLETNETVNVMNNEDLGQDIHNVTVYIAGENGNTLQLISVESAFFDLDKVLEMGLVATNDNAYTFVLANGGWKWNNWQAATIATETGLPFKWGPTEGTFIKIPCYFDGVLYMNLPSQYDKTVLLWLHEAGYELEIAATLKVDGYSGKNLNLWTTFYTGVGMNLRTDGGWQSMKVSLEDFAAVTVGSIPSALSYHLQIPANTTLGALGDEVVGYAYMQVPKFVLKTATA